MIQAVINGIVHAIKAEYPTCEVYTCDVEQGLAEPCFIVKSIEQSETRSTPVLYERGSIFIVHYFPVDRGDCYSVAENLAELLDVITDSENVNSKYIKKSFESNIDDGVLHVTVSYSTIVSRSETNETMLTYSIDQEVTYEKG